MDYAIEIKNIIKDFPGVRALDDISFSVREGEIHGFIGPNGAGKSTSMNIITGLIRGHHGSVKIFGECIRETLDKNFNSIIGFLPENLPLYPNMKVESYLLFVGQIYGLDLRRKDLKFNVDRVIESLGLKAVRKRLIGNLSRGFKQRVGIAQALVYDPKIIILDEPTVGLDPGAIVEIRELILELKKERTILLSTHQLHVANTLCTDITIINNGKIVETGSKEEICDRLSGTQIVKATVSKWQDSLKEEILGSFGESVTRVDVDKDKDKDKAQEFYQIKIQSKDKTDIRASLSQFFVANDCNLLSIEEETLDLEEIFTKATTASTAEVNRDFC